MKKVLLISPQVTATKILVDRTKRLAQSQGISMEISTMSETQGRKYINDYDVVLLSPQLRFLVSNRQKLGARDGLPIDVLNSKDFGSLDAEAFLRIIVAHL